VVPTKRLGSCHVTPSLSVTIKGSRCHLASQFEADQPACISKLQTAKIRPFKKHSEYFYYSSLISPFGAQVYPWVRSHVE
jgi:hypothetical protein